MEGVSVLILLRLNLNVAELVLTASFSLPFSLFFLTVNFDHFQILRAIGKGSFGKVM